MVVCRQCGTLTGTDGRARYCDTCRALKSSENQLRFRRARGQFPRPSFDDMLARAERTASGCWIWPGKKRTVGGYGWFGGKLVHRVVAEIFHGLDPTDDALKACHKCDNPPCVNPDHIFVGTSKDNTQDAIAKGRFPVGSAHHNSKLSDDAVAQMRSQRAAGLSLTVIAKAHGVSIATTHKIVTGASWKHAL